MKMEALVRQISQHPVFCLRNLKMQQTVSQITPSPVHRIQKTTKEWRVSQISPSSLKHPNKPKKNALGLIRESQIHLSCAGLVYIPEFIQDSADDNVQNDKSFYNVTATDHNNDTNNRSTSYHNREPDDDVEGEAYNDLNVEASDNSNESDDDYDDYFNDSGEFNNEDKYDNSEDPNDDDESIYDDGEHFDDYDDLKWWR